MLAIEIPWDPNLLTIGAFRFTWHSLFAVLGIIAGVIIVRWVGRKALPSDKLTNLALWAIFGGLIAARALYVLDNWEPQFAGNPGRIFALNEGGITVWGAVVGGTIAVILTMWLQRASITLGLDLGAPSLIMGMGIGRIGDLINGEHHALPSDFPWAVTYTHPNTIGQAISVHPATTYEMLGDFFLFGVALWLARRHLGKGYAFWAVLGGYSALRLGLQFLRIDQSPIVFGLVQSQILGVIGLGMTAYWLGRRAVRRTRARPLGRSAGTATPAGGATR
ncbi:MAG: prolipoprotein diacylglyceryl transferase [Actinobacteria bacterium]|nr:prolipoprotein diacylglyceryl transferase [Actinomycetota bacterium]